MSIFSTKSGQNEPIMTSPTQWCCHPRQPLSLSLSFFPHPSLPSFLSFLGSKCCCLCLLHAPEASYLSLPWTPALSRAALFPLMAFGINRHPMLSCFVGFRYLRISGSQEPEPQSVNPDISIHVVYGQPPLQTVVQGEKHTQMHINISLKGKKTNIAFTLSRLLHFLDRLWKLPLVDLLSEFFLHSVRRSWNVTWN